MTDAFCDLVMPVFQEVIDLQDHLAWGEKPSLEEVMERTRGWVEAAEQRAVVNADLSADFAMAKFGLVAWIDEVLTDSDWGRSVGWGSEDHVLEWYLYNSRIRAKKFFDEAALAEREAEAGGSIDPLETYLLCVTLGFRGVLAYDEPGLSEWLERVYRRVSEASPVASRPFEEGEAPRAGLGPLSGPSMLVRVSVLAAITAFLTLAAFLESVHLAYYALE